MRRAATFRVIPWTDELRQVFELMGDDWQPPGSISTTLNQAGDRSVWKAQCKQADGTPVTLTVTLERDAEGTWWTTKQNLDLRLFVEPSHASGGGRA